MADVQPFRALRYDLGVVGSLQSVIAPPYDVIDPEQRAAAGRALAAQRRRHRPPAGPARRRSLRGGRAPARPLEAPGRDRPRRRAPRMWALQQDYTGPDGSARTRRGFFARVRVEDYGPGRIRPHERTHPGPKEDRLRLTRATQANLSPIFSLYDDPSGAAWAALEPHLGGEPWGEATDADGTRQPAVAGRRRRRDGPRDDGAGRRRAADRRRPPPLRDRARLRRGDRRRGRPPLRADVPRRAAGPGADDLPHAPAAQRRQGRRRRRSALGDVPAGQLRGQPRSTPAELTPPDDRTRRARSSSATSTATSSSPSA